MSRTLDEWIVNFTRDEHPEEEIFIWESIVKAYLKIDQVKYLVLVPSSETQKGIFEAS